MTTPTPSVPPGGEPTTPMRCIEAVGCVLPTEHEGVPHVIEWPRGSGQFCVVAATPGPYRDIHDLDDLVRRGLSAILRPHEEVRLAQAVATLRQQLAEARAETNAAELELTSALNYQREAESALSALREGVEGLERYEPTILTTPTGSIPGLEPDDAGEVVRFAHLAALFPSPGATAEQADG